MSDRYLKFVNTPFGKTAAQSLGLPAPVPLKRWKRAVLDGGPNWKMPGSILRC